MAVPKSSNVKPNPPLAADEMPPRRQTRRYPSRENEIVWEAFAMRSSPSPWAWDQRLESPLPCSRSEKGRTKCPLQFPESRLLPHDESSTRQRSIRHRLNRLFAGIASLERAAAKSAIPDRNGDC